VWLRAEVPKPGVPAKLFRQWTGPFEVHEVISDSTCIICDPKDQHRRPQIVHFDRLKPAKQHGTLLEVQTESAGDSASLERGVM
jgi:hypothetical protein